MSLPNPPVDIIPREQGEILGIPVEYNPHHEGVADARGLIGNKRIVVGPPWLKLDAKVQHAVLLHEAKHCRAYHAEKRVGWLLLIAAPLVFLPVQILSVFGAIVALYAVAEWSNKRQEMVADAFAVEQGYGYEMARFVRNSHVPNPSRYYPDYESRMANIERLIRQAEQ
jgi:Zn-dependent protease with chaperone function